MQSPVYSTENSNFAQYRYGVIERVTNGKTFSELTQAGTRYNLVTTGGAGSDPIISIPNSAKTYTFCELEIAIRLYALVSCSSPPDRQVDANLIAWNNVGINSAFITIDAQPLTAQFVKNVEVIKLSSIPSEVNFSQFGLVATLLSSFNPATFPPGVDATCLFWAYVSPIVTVYN